eukprot:TRINITY_DN2675_c0_g1_i2.p1 TRINITY_DN2675_c0_g1~~TRINITY_DN2675_c0_g1_i2.p1  ORF type:complete len:183 (+),score=36.70 TRINITY_DN2675_c0_g1_i2:111-659(+)
MKSILAGVTRTAKSLSPKNIPSLKFTRPFSSQDEKTVSAELDQGENPHGGNRTQTAYQPIQLREEDLEEKFITGWGKGGQKVNKTANCVFLRHLPTGITVKNHETRHLNQNRQLARKTLISKLDEAINGEQSKKQQEIAKIRKQKQKQRSRALKKVKEAQAAQKEVTEMDNFESFLHENKPI